MNIIYIINARIPGPKAHSYQVAKMSESFAVQGANIELWASQRYDSLDQDAFDFYGLKNNFKIKIIKSFDFLKYYKILGKLAFFLQSLFFLIKLSFQKIDPHSIIYTRNPEIAWLFSLKNKKVVFEAHRWSNNKIFSYKFLLKKVFKIITVTNELKNVFLKNNFQNNILVASDAVDLEIFDINTNQEEARKKLDLPLNKKILIYSGSFKTMGEGKGIINILQALKSIIKENKEVIFVAVGANREDIKFYEKLIDDLNLKNEVLLIERVSMNKLATYYKAADVLLMPFPFTQHYAYYMSPLKMFEYMASQRPIIATNLPSVKEVLNKSNAILIKPDSEEELKLAIEKLLNNLELGKQLAKQAHIDVQEYSWNKRAKDILKFINT